MSPEEAERLAGYVGRMPTPLELHLFDTMWSEHCSYKSSRPVLGLLPTAASQVVIGPGEDAGVVRFCRVDGSDWYLVVAHESHNHPSQVLPVEGAATGVGGIVRDVYCMGALVVGTMDLLRFGDPEGAASTRTRSICRGVVEGIWRYGNALGVPNLGGDARFHPGFDENCLVNVVAAGVVREDRLVHSYAPAEAAGEPYVLVLVGKPTDDTGFGGATFASADLGEETGKGAVQVADPFLKRVLVEAMSDVLEMLAREGAAFGYKDLGAGGIACVTSEMAAHGGFGIEVDLDRVPVSVPGLPPEVVACAETQERYGLAVPERLAGEVLRTVNEDYELPRLYPGAGASVIGRFDGTGEYRVLSGGGEVARAPVGCITEGVLYDRPSEPAPVEPSEPSERPVSPETDLPAMLLSVDGASRAGIWSYYDSEVQGNTVLRPGEADACVCMPVPGSGFGLAMAGDGNPWYGELDPYLAGAHAVGEAVRNVVATGAVPLAATDCLNFGNPEVPEVFWGFRRAVEGISEACRSLGMLKEGEPLPIVSGNVSFYNQSRAGGSVPPSPIVAVFGRLEDAAGARDVALRREEDLLVLVGPRRDELGGSLYYREVLGHRGGRIPLFRGELERRMARFVLDCIGSGLVESAHDISEGGVAACVAEMCLASPPDAPLGAALTLPADPVALYSETPGYVLEMSPGAWESLRHRPDFAEVVGRVTGGGALRGDGWSVDLASLRAGRDDLLSGLVWREEER